MLVIFLANGFVTFYYWSSYQHGMPAARALLLFVPSVIAVNGAIVLGRMLAERSTRPK
jgi:hypothetical protein